MWDVCFGELFALWRRLLVRVPWSLVFWVVFVGQKNVSQAHLELGLESSNAEVDVNVRQRPER